MQKLLSLLFLVTLSAAAAADGGPGDRVVCVSKQINEFIYAIGAQDHLVARDLTSIYPPEIQKLPSVGYHRALSAEGIISMRPSVFLTDGNLGPQSVLDELNKVGVPIKTMAPGNSLEGAEQLLTDLGAYFHREQAAAAVLAQWKQGIATVQAQTAALAGKPKPRVLLIHFGQIINNYLAVNPGGPADQMIAWAGGVNAMDAPGGKQGGMTRLTPELIAASKPDVIIATDVGFDRFGSVQKFEELPGVSLTPAGKAGRIYRVDETEVMYFGPRTPATLRKLAAIFHP